MDATKTASQVDFENAKALVEATIRKLGLDPAAVLAPAHQSDTQAAWTLKRGSASVLVMVIHRAQEKSAYLRIAAPVVSLPADANQHMPLFKYVLELNAAGLANAAFGLTGDKIIAVSERPAQGLGAEEVEQCVRHLAAVADTFDDRLAKQFGGIKA
jgi:hypothetical protein